MADNNMSTNEYQLKPFDRKEFEQEVEQWLIGKNRGQKQPFYHFLTLISLINLSEFKGLNKI